MGFPMTIDFENILNVPDDLRERVRQWRNSTHVNQYMITNHHITKEEHQRWIEKLKTQNTTKAWIIRYSGKPVGIVSLPHIDYTKKTAEWGLYIADETVRGKGIGSTALYKLMEYVFEKLCFNTMTTFVLENNPVAIRMYEKFGFKRDQKTTQQIARDEKRITIYTMQISKKEWERRKEKIVHSPASDLL
jgi:UDP-4-amino-4,6-dideoxy-N-acetyl-beta-L-altrosamine N-acetyltransferase